VSRTGRRTASSAPHDGGGDGQRRQRGGRNCTSVFSCKYGARRGAAGLVRVSRRALGSDRVQEQETPEDIHTVARGVKINCIAGNLKTNQQGEFRTMKVWYIPEGIANIFLMNELEKKYINSQRQLGRVLCGAYPRWTSEVLQR
jgi:hypothetical protein